MRTPSPSRHLPSLSDRLAGLAATLTLVAVVAGLPAVLLAIGADPLPNKVPTWDAIQNALASPDDGTLFLNAIAVIAWIAWAFMAISVLVEILAALRGVRTPQLPALPGLRLSQGAARSLVATAALLFIAAPALLQPGSPGTTGASAVEPSAATHASTTQSLPDHLSTDARGPATDRSDRSGRHAAHHAGNQHRPATRSHTVGPGETLWSIARTHLGDGARYLEIVELNRDLLGKDPGFLEIGWVLQVPDINNSGDQDDGADVLVGIDLEDGERVVTVKAHDTLSEIADAELDDPHAYPEIFEASKNITQPGGAHLTDPDMIDVGWTLVIPDNATTGSSSGGDTGKGGAGPEDAGGVGLGLEQSGEHDPPPLEEPTTPRADPPADTRDGPLDTAPGGDDDRGDSVRGTETVDQDGVLHAPWQLIGLTGGGAVLAAGLYLELKARRRAQWRARRPGRAVAVPGPELAPVEKTISTTGAAAAVTVEFMDEALRRLAGQHARHARPMPAVAAVELNDHHLVLHLTEAITLDAPWEGTADALHWRCGSAVDLDSLGPAVEELVDQPFPYPMLVTVGSSDEGAVWLLNCEELAAVTISGDQTYVRDFARYLAAELAVNPWSEGMMVDCVGIAEEVAPMGRDRIRYHRTGAAGDQAAEILADAVAAIDRCEKSNTDVVTGRIAQTGADVWPARLLLVNAIHPGQSDEPQDRAEARPADARTDAGTDAGSVASTAPEPSSLPDLLRLTLDHTGHTGTAVVIAGAANHGSAEVPSTVLHITSTGRIQLHEAGLDLIAVRLSSDEAHGCAALLAQSEDLSDTEMPVDETAEDGWEAYTNQSGSLRTEYTLPRRSTTETATGVATLSHPDDADPDEDSEQDDHPDSVLTGADEDYVTGAAATAEDLAALAPEVSVSVRAKVEAANLTLDDDVAAWFNPRSNRPKLTLLGPVVAQAHGKALVERKAYFTELLTYLALRRRHGATPDEVADAFNLKPPKVRGYVKVVRDWLGTNPATGTKHLPDATDAPATKRSGVNVYQVDDGLLIDADLFRRLWSRGQSRGPAGIHDLRQALDLVAGRPFDQLRKGAWSWLLEGDRTDLHMQAAVADVAHLVATHGLTTGDLDLARYAVEKAMLAAPDEDTTQFNRAALAAAEGFPEEAERILREEVCNRSDNGHAPLDLTARANAILSNRDWLATG